MDRVRETVPGGRTSSGKSPAAVRADSVPCTCSGTWLVFFVTSCVFTGADVTVRTRIEGRLGKHHVHRTRRSWSGPAGLCHAVSRVLIGTGQ